MAKSPPILIFIPWKEIVSDLLGSNTLRPRLSLGRQYCKDGTCAYNTPDVKNSRGSMALRILPIVFMMIVLNGLDKQLRLERTLKDNPGKRPSKQHMDVLLTDFG